MLVNTCAIREHAEHRVFGNVGALSHTKRRHPGQVICVCGCMARQEHVAQRLRQSFPYVDLVFGPQLLWQFPQLLLEKLTTGKRVFATQDVPGAVAEGIPVVRQNPRKAWVSIMYGCNNFCTYCIVPYVRGRERSRQPEDILAEVRELAAAGYQDITLLGQNVNSYGKDLEPGGGLCLAAGAGERHPRGLPHPLHDQPPQGAGSGCLTPWPPARRWPPSSTSPSSPAAAGC